jgi:hypothetical protein
MDQVFSPLVWRDSAFELEDRLLDVFMEALSSDNFGFGFSYFSVHDPLIRPDGQNWSIGIHSPSGAPSDKTDSGAGGLMLLCLVRFGEFGAICPAGSR